MKWHQRLSSLLSLQPIKPQTRSPRRVLLRLEELETRALLSASGVTAQTNTTTIAPAQSSAFSGYTPAQIEAAYGVPSSANGQLPGTGETIAIVDAFNDPNIQNDLAAFDAQYGLPAANLTVVNQNGGSALPANNASWAVEESLDVEWAHAIAPGANIVLVEANSASLNNLMTAVQTAASTQGVSVVSMSWGAGEFSGETYYDSYFQPYSSSNPNGYTNSSPVTFVASAGDSSAYFGPEWPASSPDVLAVGGTTLKLTSSNTIASETAWSASFSRYYGMEGGGGGISSYEPTPSFQSSNGVSYGGRSTPDVAWDANPSTGVSVYDSYQEPGWGYVGGTSVGSPSWAGVVAIADQEAGHSLSTAQVESTLYGAYSSSGGANYTSGSEYTTIFNDITSGNNGYAATKGYDLATGLGSPKVSALVALLAGTSSASSSTTSNTTSGTTGGTTTGSSHGSGHGAVHSHDVLETIGGTSVSTIVVSVTNVPISVPSASSTGASVSASVSALNTNVSPFVLSILAEPSMSSASGNSLVNSASDSFGSQSALLFGASGWSGSSLSWRLNSVELPSPLGEPSADDLPENWQDLNDPSTGNAILATTNASGEDWSVLDVMAPPLLESDGSGGDSDGSDGGE
jgi:subtilase family serine protease